MVKKEEGELCVLKEQLVEKQRQIEELEDGVKKFEKQVEVMSRGNRDRLTAFLLRLEKDRVDLNEKESRLLELQGKIDPK